ncbi:hypothetical protein SteCoe_837 [Stentor coeruleus]|uniref:Acid phosphatase n=1 Tax=Stentor coeruleus TaxID=5963 RepID=A0A1R2D3C5_9CILI|nr:hypothetical protein SteCoe_837 [Stentor coeruleus]
MIFFILITTVTSRLVGVVELCRHGARTPTKLWPWDTGRWPEGLGELLPEGMRQHYFIGQVLRTRYIQNQKLIMPFYYQPEIFVYSSDHNRTLMSAESQIQGLFPNGTGPNLRSSAMITIAVPPVNVTNLNKLINSLNMSALPGNIQLTPIHTDDTIRQYALNPSSSCQYYMYLSDQKSAMSSELQEIFDKYNDTVNVVMQVLNCSRAYAQKNMQNIGGSVTCNEFMGYALPAQFTPTVINNIQELAYEIKSFTQFKPDFLARLAGTPFMMQMIGNLQNCMSGNITQKFFLYSAHDTDISFILAFLQLDFSQPPPFASTIFFELYQYGVNYYVNVKYNDVLQLIPTCGGYNCSLDTFVKYVQFRSIPDIINVCNTPVYEMNQTKNLKASKESFDLPGDGDSMDLKWYFWFSFGVYIGLLVLILTTIIVVCIKKVNKELTSSQSLISLKTR